MERHTNGGVGAGDNRRCIVQDRSMGIDIHRGMAMNAVRATTTWQACWATWEPEISRRTDGLASATKIYDLGGQLGEVFALSSSLRRDQSSVAGAGTAWECLVCWYLNLVFSGTRAVALRQSRLTVPKVLFDATTITYGNFQTNTESDLCVIVYPRGFEFPGEPRRYLEHLNAAVEQQLGAIEMGVIQCKTNWNENAQIPMLWDMVYQASFGAGTSVKVGRGGYAVDHLAKFTYSFVTVPTQKRDFNVASMPVKRTRGLSGGNYWGRPSKDGVALSVADIFNRNFKSAFDTDVKSSIAAAIAAKQGLFA